MAKIKQIKNLEIRNAFSRAKCYNVRPMRRRPRQILRIAVALWMNGASGRDILSGIFRYARTRNVWDIQLMPLPNGVRPEIPAQMAEAGVDGIISASFSPQVKSLLDATAAPLVFIGPSIDIPRPMGGAVVFVNQDDEGIGAMGARHFLALGAFNGFGYLHAISDSSWIDLREKGFRDVLTGAGKACSTLTLDMNPEDHINHDVLGDWLESLPKPAAVMAFFDYQALQILNVCRERHIAVPGQVSVLGVDNDELLCEFSDPPLSSIQPDHEQTGYLAARELDALMTRPGKRPHALTCPVLRIVERGSARPLTPSAHLVRKAREFIRAKAERGIDVADVVAHLKVSRRLADLRFREVENRSIRQVIEDRRMELAEKALAETDWTLRRIAAASGYRNVKTFEAAFRRKHGMSPSAFRKR